MAQGMEPSPGTSKGEYSHLKFTQNIGPSLNELRSKQLLCDTVIEVETKQFHVHRCVLAATSPYFKSMFTENWSESKDKIIRLAGTKIIGFEEVVHFAYTGQAELNKDNIKDVLIAAHLYCYPALTDLCAEYMLATMDEHNCLYYMRLAETYDAESVYQKADQIVFTNFNTVVKSTEFLDVSKEALCRFILCEELRVNTKEIDIFLAVCSWISHQQERTNLASELMKNIQFNLLSSGQLKEHVIPNKIIRQDHLCSDMVFDSLLLCRQTCPVHMHGQMSMFILDNSGKILSAEQDEPSKFTLRTLFQTPNEVSSKVAHYKCIKYGNALFLVLHNHGCGPATPSLLQYDVTRNRWQQMTGMKVLRTGHEVVVVDGHIIVIGGSNQTGVLSSVEQYTIRDDTWHDISNLPYPLQYMGACSFEDSIYVNGGLDSYCNNLIKQNEDKTGWENLAPMPTNQCQHTLVSVGSDIFSIGDGFKNQPCLCLLYNPGSNQWSTLKSNITRWLFCLRISVYNQSMYTIYQCNVHPGKCLVRLDHQGGEIRATCVKTLDTEGNLFC